MLMDTNGHTILSEDYVSYEIAKLLKEKGFEGDINAYYHIWDNGNKVCPVKEFSRSEAPHLYIPAPTHQLAMKWLRKKYNIYISIQPDFPSDKNYKMCWFWSASILHENCISTKVFQFYIDSYEEAVEAALKYCLENLI